MAYAAKLQVQARCVVPHDGIILPGLMLGERLGGIEQGMLQMLVELMGAVVDQAVAKG